MWAPHSGLQKPRVRTSLFPETFLPVTGLPGFQLYQEESVISRSKNLLQEFKNRPLDLTAASNPLGI